MRAALVAAMVVRCGRIDFELLLALGGIALREISNGRTRCAALVALIIAGCGRIDFRSGARDADAPLDTRDAYVPLGPFGNMRAIPGINSGTEDDDPGVSPDGLELYFASKRTGVSKIWKSVRSSRNEDWPAPTQVLELDASTDDKAPELSSDGLTIYYAQTSHIAVATRATLTSPWSTPQRINELASPVGTPAVCDDGLRLFMRIGGTTATEDVAVSSRASTSSTWSAPVPVSELDTPTSDSAPWVTADCRRIYFDSLRTGSERIYVADFDPVAGMFGPPTMLSELEVLGSVHDASLTADERYIVFARDNAGVTELYEAWR